MMSLLLLFANQIAHNDFSLLSPPTLLITANGTAVAEHAVINVSLSAQETVTKNPPSFTVRLYKNKKRLFSRSNCST